MFTMIKKTIGVVLLTFMLFVAPVMTAMAAPPPPPGPPTSSDGGGVFIGGAPIAGGLLILVALGAGYGARKVYNARKRKISE